MLRHVTQARPWRAALRVTDAALELVGNLKLRWQQLPLEWLGSYAGDWSPSSLLSLSLPRQPLIVLVVLRQRRESESGQAVGACGGECESRSSRPGPVGTCPCASGRKPGRTRPLTQASRLVPVPRDSLASHRDCPTASVWHCQWHLDAAGPGSSAVAVTEAFKSQSR